MTTKRRYVVPRDPDLEMQVDAVMRGFKFASYAEMFRVLIADAYRHAQKRERIRTKPEDQHEGQFYCPLCKQWINCKLWDRDTYFCDEYCPARR